MSEAYPYDESIRMSAEYIEEETGFKLIMMFPGFGDSGYISPDFHEERERLSAELGEDSIMSSFYLDSSKTIQLGLFLKPPE